jgi:hypothetical protein
VGLPARSPDLEKVAYREVSPFHAPDSAPQPGEELPSNLWVVNADGTNPHRLVDQGPTDTLSRSDAAWSPDGSWVAFTEQGVLSGSLVLIQPDGTRRFVAAVGSFAPPGGSGPVPPAWSPDGAALAYVGWDEQGRATLQTITPDGLTSRQYSAGFPYGGGPYWVPLEGDSGPPGVAYAVASEGGDLSWHVVDPTDGTIYPRPGGLTMVDTESGWTVQVRRDGLAVFSLDGPVVVALPEDIRAVSWGPGGAQMVIARAGIGLVLIDPQQGADEPITGGNDLAPVWTPPAWLVLP